MRPQLIAVLVAAASLFGPSSSGDAAVTKTIYSFCKKANCADGEYPNGLISDAAGNLYGAAEGGGTHGGGVVFELIRPVQEDGKWKEQVLYNFCSAGGCSEGSQPASPLVIDSQGNLYGTAMSGGKFDRGAVFQLSPATQKSISWQIAVLHSFCNKDPSCGYFPQFGLAYEGQSSGTPYDGTSPLFGTSNGGGTQGIDCVQGCGIVFELTHKTKGKFGTLYEFCVKVLYCPDGALPAGPLLVDASGNLIGTTMSGGANGNNGGTIFEMTHAKDSWAASALYSFCNDNCLDGTVPASGVISDASGNLFGMTQFGGHHSQGTLFKFVPSNPTQVTVLHDFCSNDDCADGSGPWSNGLAIDASGNLFGTTANGGGNDEVENGAGTVFESGQQFSRLHAFCTKAGCADGELPSGPIVLSSSNKIYGAAFGDGRDSKGLIFEVTP
jgi:uncharacterized repeat protein (TIGR03803 family)